jgi:hypothetical protein
MPELMLTRVVQCDFGFGVVMMSLVSLCMMTALSLSLFLASSHHYLQLLD